MTTFPTMSIFNDALKGTDKFLVGYDRMFDQLAKAQNQMSKNIPNYPPYNIRKTDDTNYVIEMAVAGFSESDIDITVDDDKLTVEGSVKESEGSEDMLYQGLALRNFSRSFTLNDQVKVKEANMENGLLKVHLERIVPETNKSRKIEVTSATSNRNKLLNE